MGNKNAHELEDIGRSNSTGEGLAYRPKCLCGWETSVKLLSASDAIALFQVHVLEARFSNIVSAMNRKL